MAVEFTEPGLTAFTKATGYLAVATVVRIFIEVYAHIIADGETILAGEFTLSVYAGFAVGALDTAPSAVLFVCYQVDTDTAAGL